jgi:hypothetical protein
LRPVISPLALSADGMMMVSQTIVPNPSICAPSWILTASPSFSSTAASAASDVSGVYGVTKDEGETVVGWEIPAGVDGQSNACRYPAA